MHSTQAVTLNAHKNQSYSLIYIDVKWTSTFCETTDNVSASTKLEQNKHISLRSRSMLYRCISKWDVTCKCYIMLLVYIPPFQLLEFSKMVYKNFNPSWENSIQPWYEFQVTPSTSYAGPSFTQSPSTIAMLVQSVAMSS